MSRRTDGNLYSHSRVLASTTQARQAASARAREAIIERLPDEELGGVLDLWTAFPDPAAPVGS